MFKYFLCIASNAFDVCVIGSGPGGYVAAIKAAQLGLKTACIERYETLGGTCLNVGCIPSKSLLYNSSLFHMMKSGDMKSRGINCDNITLNLDAMMKHKQQAVNGLTQGVSMLFKANKVTRFHGIGRVNSQRGVVEITNAKTNGIHHIEAKNIIIATGSSVLHIPGIRINEQNIVSSTGALSLPQVPSNLVVLGGGAIGLELGSVWSRLGSKVTIIEMINKIGGVQIDKEISNMMSRMLKKSGISIKTQTKVDKVIEKNGSVNVKCISCSNPSAMETLECDVLLVSAGRRPNCDDLGLDKAGVKLDEKGRIQVNNCFQTNVDNVFAIGDCIRGPMLAHKAEDEGILCAEYIANGTTHTLNFNNIPNVIYTHPEVAWVGSNEETLRKSNIPYKVGKFPMIANSRAKTIMDSDGMCKILMDPNTGFILGAHLMNSIAGDMISEAVLAMENQLTCDQISRTCHAHPTWSEAFKEAALQAHSGKAINTIN